MSQLLGWYSYRFSLSKLRNKIALCSKNSILYARLASCIESNAESILVNGTSWKPFAMSYPLVRLTYPAKISNPLDLVSFEGLQKQDIIFLILFCRVVTENRRFESHRARFPSYGSTLVTLSYSALLPNYDCLSRGRQWTPQSYRLRRRKSGIMTGRIYSYYWQSFWEHSSS